MGQTWRVGLATTCETESWECAAQHRALSSGLCDDREGGMQGVGGRPMTEGIHGYILLSHAGTQRKVTQHCKAIISQFFIYFYFLNLFIFYCSGFCHTLKWISHGFTSVPNFLKKNLTFFIKIKPTREGKWESGRGKRKRNDMRSGWPSTSPCIHGFWSEALEKAALRCLFMENSRTVSALELTWAQMSGKWV